MKWLTWFLAFVAIQFGGWLVYYYADLGDCTDPYLAACYPKLSAALSTATMVLLYGMPVVFIQIRRHFGNENVADTLTSRADYYWRFIALASIPAPIAFALVWNAAPHRRMAVAYLMWIGPLLVALIVELGRFLRAATRGA